MCKILLPWMNLANSVPYGEELLVFVKNILKKFSSDVIFKQTAHIKQYLKKRERKLLVPFWTRSPPILHVPNFFNSFFKSDSDSTRQFSRKTWYHLHFVYFRICIFFLRIFSPFFSRALFCPSCVRNWTYAHRIYTSLIN